MDANDRQRRPLALARKFAEGVSALLLGTIFVAFIVQVVFRYALNLPVGWTSDLSVAAWLWLVLWGAAFVLRDEDEIRFDIIVNRVGRRARRVIAFVGALAVVVLFALSLKPSYDYVAFMKVETSSYLKVRMDLMYSIYVVFVVAVIARYLWKLVGLLRGRDAIGADPGEGGSAR